uniref:Glycosyltransferase family 2 protein n=1 Tax=Acidobacterium capsulatum TaxID=33075 RepID=A0A7V4XTV8_9BACT
MSATEKAASVALVVISFNTREMLRDCLATVFAEQELLQSATGRALEVHVVDNASRDGSAGMVAAEFPAVRLTRSPVNLGFGPANNRALRTILAEGHAEYIVLLNSDAFLHPGALAEAVRQMDAAPRAGAGGARLVHGDGRWQASARHFHSLLDDAIVATGLAAKFPHSRFFGRFDRTWADQNQAAQTDWVPGAFMILRAEALRAVGIFDERFFLYYEEVDLCRRMHAAGWQVWYWPGIGVTHLCGESSRTLRELDYSSREAQVVKWRMRSMMLYYRKHHGAQAWLSMSMERLHRRIIFLRNRWSRQPERRIRAQQQTSLLALLRDAWHETQGGRVSPPQPW